MNTNRTQMKRKDENCHPDGKANANAKANANNNIII